MPKKSEKDTFVNPLDRLKALSSPYAKTEPDSETVTKSIDQSQPEIKEKALSESSMQSTEEMSSQTSHVTDTKSHTLPEMDMSRYLNTGTHSDTYPQTFNNVDKLSISQTYTNTSTEDEWSSLPSDAIRKQAVQKGEYFEEVNDHLSSWVDKKLKEDFTKLRKKLGTKRRPLPLVYALNEALRDMLRKYHYLLELSIKLKRTPDDLLLEAIKDLVKKYQGD